jgi:Methyltransferase domain
MNFRELIDGLSCVNARAAVLALRRPSQLRRYISHCLKTYDELAGSGLPLRMPVTPAENITVTIPAGHSGGGMSFGELVILARTTKVLKPKTVFEMGSYNGMTTAVFVLNTESNAQILTLDLPSSEAQSNPQLTSDQELVSNRNLLSVPRALGLSRYTQLLCDSMKFDPSPYTDSINLGLVDAAHDAVHVENDTIKMAKMMSPDGIVFWHDYGGKGALRPLALYLEALAKRCPLYRIRGTSLAWGPARELKAALG